MKKVYVDIFISAKNNLIVRVKDSQTSFDLNTYSYDINKPFAENNNLFTDEKLVKDIQNFINPNISKIWFISQPVTLYIAIAKFFNKDGFNHILNFGEVIGGNTIELAYINKSDETIPDRQEIRDNIAARRNANIGLKKTQFFMNAN